MVFAPVSEEIREKVIGYHLAGHGRNRIDRLLSEQGVKVSHGSISNIIARYRREHEQPPQPQSIQQQQTATNPSPVVGKGVDDINNTNNTDEEINFDDQAYENASEAMLSGEYNPLLDVEGGERLLGFEQGVNISDTQNNNNVVKENASIEEKKFEQSKSESVLPNIKNSPTLDSESETEGLDLSLGMDWDESSNYQTRFTKWVMREKRNRQNEKGMLALHWKRLKEERQIFEIRRKEFEAAEADLAQRIKNFKDLIPFAAELRQIGLDFSLSNSWLSYVKEMSERKGLDIRSAAWKLAEDLKSWQELGRKICMSEAEVLKLVKVVNGWGNNNGNGFELDDELNL